MADGAQRLLQQQSVHLSSDESRRLLIAFRELCSYYDALITGNEEECLALVDLLDKTRLKWLSAYNEAHDLREILRAAELESTGLRSQLKTVGEQLKDARSQVAALMSAKKATEAELLEYDKKMEMIRAIKMDIWQYVPEKEQKKLAFLDDEPRLGVRAHGTSFTVIEDDAADVDYDKTGDSLDDEEAGSGGNASMLRSGRVYRRVPQVPGNNKRSRSIRQQVAIAEEEKFDEDTGTQRKRSKETPATDNDDDHERRRAAVTPATTVVCSSQGGVHTSRPPRISIRQSMNRSMSEPRLSQHFDPRQMPPPMSESRAVRPSPLTTINRYNTGGSAFDLRSGKLQSWASGTSIDSRPHAFHTTKWTLSLENCDICKKRFGFAEASYKCQDCQLICHGKCRSFAPIPCVPRIHTPKTPTNQRARLCDYCPSTPPRIPHIIVHCVVELERRGLGFTGIYRIPGSEAAVNDLLQRFKKNRVVQNLAESDVETITGCIKKFLQELREPLIPTTSWNEFVIAAESRMQTQMDRVITDLPATNRDTLAYLCAHWQRVAEMSGTNKMPLSNLAVILGPTVVGYSTSCTPANMQQASMDTAKQKLVMMALLSMPSVYWTNFYTINTSGESPGLTSPNLGDHSLLGPVRTPGRGAYGTYQRTPLQSSLFLPPWK